MKSVKLNFLLMFFLIFGLSYQGYADCPWNVPSNTDLESFFAGWEEWRKGIKVTAIKDQGVDGYFNPKIKVCGYDEKKYPEYCHELYSGTSCKKIYGTQDTGAGISAAVFIDWEGNKMLDDGTIKGGIAKGLGWEWADGVTDEEKKKFANSPKICACSQKGACMSGISSWGAKTFAGTNIFRPGGMENVCDTCYQTKVKCAPVPLAPGPPPFCEQLAMSPPQVRIVPITNENNDYFNPKVEVMISGLEERKELGFPHVVSNNEDIRNYSYTITDKDTHYYFKTYRKKGQLCAEYSGTQSIDEKNPQFIRCFPAPPTPEPEVVKVVDENTLEIKMRMSESTCSDKATYSDNGLCTFNVNNQPTNIGPLSLKVVKPRIVKKTTNSNGNKNNINDTIKNTKDIIEGIFEKSSRFEILKQHGLTPNIGIQLSDGKDHSITNSTKDNGIGSTKRELDDMEQSKIEVRYMQVRDQANSNSKMLCLSGWQPEPEEFVLKRGDEIIPLKLMGTKYIKYNAVYSKESNRFYYLPSKEKEIVDLLKRPQDQLDKIIFNKQGYVFFPDENKQEKGKCSYCVKRNDEIDDAFRSGKGLKVVYKLTDVDHKEGCEQGDDCCICFDGTHRCSAQYLNKEDGKPFCLRYSEVSCQDKEGKTAQCRVLEGPIKANRTEVFYADKLCMLNREGLKEKLKKIFKKQLENKKQEFEKKSEKSYDFESGSFDMNDSQITSSHVEIEVWGCGEAGHIKDTPTSCKSHVDEDTQKNACSTETRAGMPGDYIKAELELDPDYPTIDINISEGGGNEESRYTDKDGGPIFIKKCRLDKRECKNLIIMGGGGIYKMYPSRDNYKDYMETRIDDSVKLKERTIGTLRFTEDNKMAYIENGEIKYEAVKCRRGFRSSKPGAGGCIDKSKGIYGKGSAGYVKITPIIKGFDINIINDAIEKMIGNRYDLGEVKDFVTGDIDTSIVKIIEEEIKKELLGSKDSKS